MRHPFLVIVASVAACTLSGCEKKVENSPRTADRTPSVRVVGGFVADTARNDSIAAAVQASNPPAVTPEPVETLDLNDDSVGDPLQLITAKIDTTVTLGEWLKTHPADRVSTIGIHASTSDEETFCRAAVIKTRIGKRPFVRSALFHIPVPPKGEQLPADTTGVERNCELRAVMLSSAEMDTESSKAALDSLVSVIDTRLGKHAPAPTITGGGIPRTEGGSLWRQGTTSLVVAAPPIGGAESEGSGDGSTAKLFAVAYGPGGGAEGWDSFEARYESIHGPRPEDRQLLYRNVDSAAVWAGVPGVAADLKTVVAYLRARDEESRTPRPASIDAALLRALRAIHVAAPALPPPRRAAALLAGDIALAATFAAPTADTNHAILRALPSLGLNFPEDPGGYGPQNPRAWLWEAYRIDSTGRAGRLALVELLGLQWPDEQCAFNTYQKVIDHGEAALARGDDNPLIHYYLGSAYKTIYDLAHFQNDEVGNPDAYKSQAEPARLKGIEHMRATLRSLPDRPTRVEAWMKGMRMMLHLSGEQPEYACFPD